MKIEGGLLPLKKDKRDFTVGAAFQLPKLEDLPKTFSLGESKILDQNYDGNYDECLSYATVGGSRFQDGVDMYPQYHFAASKDISGDVEGFGQDLRTGMKAWTIYACAEVSDIPQEIKDLPPAQQRYLSVYPDRVINAAKLNIKPTYFSVEGKYDAYDNIRASLYAFRHLKQVVYVGVMWRWDLNEYILKMKPGNFFGHCMYVKGWDEDGLITVNSAGEWAGQRGEHRLTREVVNNDVPIFGAFMLTDIPREEAEKRLKENMTQQISIIQKIINLWLELKKKLWVKQQTQ